MLNDTLSSVLTNLHNSRSELDTLLSDPPKSKANCSQEPEKLPEFPIDSEEITFDDLLSMSELLIPKVMSFATKLDSLINDMHDHEFNVNENGILCLNAKERDTLILLQDGTPVEKDNKTIIFVHDENRFWHFTLVDVVLGGVSVILALTTIFTCCANFCPQFIPFLKEKQPEGSRDENEPMTRMARVRQVRFSRSPARTHAVAPPRRRDSSSSSSSPSSSGAPELKFLG